MHTLTRAHKHRHSSPCSPPNDCSHHYLPAVCGCVLECADMKREQSHAHSVFPWMSSERERVMSQFPLHSSLPWICPRAAFHPHHRISDGTFLPPPLLVFSLSAPFLLPIHMFSPLFNLRVLFSCTHSWTLASSFCHFFLFFCPSIPLLCCLFWQRAHFKLFLWLCVCQPCGSTSTKLWRPHMRS